MAKDHDKSLGDQPSIAGTGGGEDHGPQSLGDQATFAGGALGSGTQSLGDQSTMGGAEGDMAFDDGMEIVDLAARYTTEGVRGNRARHTGPPRDANPSTQLGFHPHSPQMRAAAHRLAIEEPDRRQSNNAVTYK